MGQAFDFDNYLIGKGLADRTVTIYRHAVERWLVECAQVGIDPLEATPLNLRAYSEGLPDTESSRRQHRVALMHWYTYRTGGEGPTGAIRAPKRRRMKWNGIEAEQAVAVVQVSRGVFPEGAATLIGLLMGLRRAEIAAVYWPKFDPELGWYDVLGKGNLEEDIPVHPIVAEEIAPHQTRHPYLFPGRASAHIGPSMVGVWVAAIGEAAGVPDLTPHKLRHTFISDVYDQDGDLRAAQELARHASPETTAGYTRRPRERMVKASVNLSYAPVRAAVNQ